MDQLSLPRHYFFMKKVNIYLISELYRHLFSNRVSTYKLGCISW
jgi:hypothetical protein